MTTPLVGVTHDVVIYDAASNHDPIGLVVVTGSYRVTKAPTFVPRLAQGDPRGVDLAPYVSWVQDDWRGASGVPQVGFGNKDYYKMVGMQPDVMEGYLYMLPGPFQVDITFTSTPNTIADWWDKGFGRAAVVHGVATTHGTFGDDLFQATTRIFAHKWEHELKYYATGPVYSYANNALPGLTFSAVQWSNTGFISTYGALMTESGGYKSLPNLSWKSIIASAYNSHWEPVGTTTAGALGVYDDKLWRAEPVGHRISYYNPTATSGDYWSDWIDTDQNGSIYNMATFIGRLFIGRDDGLWAYEAGRTYQVIDFSSAKSADNFRLLKAAAGALWFNIGSRLLRYTAGGLLEEMETGHRDMMPVSLCEVPDGVLVALRDPLGWTVRNKRYELIRLDITTGAVQHLIDAASQLRTNLNEFTWADAVVAPVIGARQPSPIDEMSGFPPTTQVKGIIFGPLFHTGTTAGSGPGSYRKQATIFFDRHLATGELDDIIWDHPDQKGNTHYMTTPWVDLGYPQVNKAWARCRVRAWVANEYNYVFVRYKLKGDTSWGYLGALGGVGESGSLEDTFDFPVGSNSRAVKLKVEFWLNFLGNEVFLEVPAKLYELELDGLFLDQGGADEEVARKQVRFTADVLDGIQLLNREVENNAAEIQATLYSYAMAGTPQVVALPWPAPVGHTIRAKVELDQGGAIVPILSYGHSSPGVQLSVIVTEV